jgi:leader peptidase (prepilin peptidase)/N-methyltransferase
VLLLVIFLLGLCWGSFLNVLAYRTLHNKNFFTARSYCPHCRHVIAWYDNIPLLSWLFLRGRCRVCSASISWLYLFTESLTALVMTVLFYKTIIAPIAFLDFGDTSVCYIASSRMYSAFGAIALFFSALIAATRTDLEALLIPQLFSLWMVPFGIAAAYFGFLQITWEESIIGSVIGYGVLWLVAFIFKRVTGKEGMGVGDMELLAMIGSFLGPLGVWMSLLFGSFSGLLCGALYLLLSGKNTATRIPFGPFLALGAAMYYFLSPVLLNLLLGR